MYRCLRFGMACLQMHADAIMKKSALQKTCFADTMLNTSKKVIARRRTRKGLYEFRKDGQGACG